MIDTNTCFTNILVNIPTLLGLTRTALCPQQTTASEGRNGAQLMNHYITFCFEEEKTNKQKRTHLLFLIFHQLLVYQQLNVELQIVFSWHCVKDPCCCSTHMFAINNLINSNKTVLWHIFHVYDNSIACSFPLECLCKIFCQNAPVFAYWTLTGRPLKKQCYTIEVNIGLGRIFTVY